MTVDLASKFGHLNQEQKRAVLCDSNTVVLAGPGSGKTDTLVMKVAHLLTDVVIPPRSVACITFNNDAVAEFQKRLASLGIRGSHRLFLGTVHSFCLNCVLRPFMKFVKPKFPKGIKVAPPTYADKLLGTSIYKVMPDANQWYSTTITRYRRRLACREDVSGFDDRDSSIVEDYLAHLDTEGLVDFEGIIGHALELIESENWVCDFLAARFPWLVVDEYQDLGGPLHRIVVNLVERANVDVFAVGDPDQTIYDFTGADPKYLTELASRPDFTTFRLRLNYRSGKKLILASQVALDLPEPRDYEPDPERKDLGEVYFAEVDNGYDGQSTAIAQDIIPTLDRAGLRREEVAILYRTKGPLFDAIARELTDAGISFVAERDGRYPRSPFVKWLQKCAAWSLSDPTISEVTFEDILEPYTALRCAAGLDEQDAGSLESRKVLYVALTGQEESNLSLAEWLLAIDSRLSLRETLKTSSDHPEMAEDFEKLLGAAQPGGHLKSYSVADFSGDGRMLGKVMLTTLHSSKGRQFDAVILPGLQESVFPRMIWSTAQRRYVDPSTTTMHEERRLFYVGFTRARKFVFLVCSPWFVNGRGYLTELGPSRFVTEIQKRLSDFGP